MISIVVIFGEVLIRIWFCFEGLVFFGEVDGGIYYDGVLNTD